MSWGRGSTRVSRRQRAIILARDRTCYLQYAGCTITATEDDHVIPLSAGGIDTPDTIANRRGACHHCHRIKSQQEAAAARRRQAATSKHPVEPHPGLRR